MMKKINNFYRLIYSNQFENNRSETIGAAGDGGSLIVHPIEVSPHHKCYQFSVDINPGPGAEILRHYVGILYNKAITLVEHVA